MAGLFSRIFGRKSQRLGSDGTRDYSPATFETGSSAKSERRKDDDSKSVQRDGKHWFSGAPETLAAWIQKLEMALSPGRFEDSILVRAYHGQSILPSAGHAMTTQASAEAMLLALLSPLEAMTQENLVRSVVDTAGSMIVRTPAVAVQTGGSRFKKMHSARKLSRLLTGVFHASGHNEAISRWWVDSATNKVGWLKWDVQEDGKITCERALPHTISWNPADGARPRSIFQRTGVPIHSLTARFTDKAQDLEDRAPVYREDPTFSVDDTVFMPETDRREVCEAWRTTEGDDKGRHVMTCGDIVLVDEEWDLPVWPLVPLVYDDSYSQLGGDALAKQVMPFQYGHNQRERLINEAQGKCIAPKILAPNGCVNGWTNGIEVIPINTTLGKPEIMMGQALPAEFYNHHREKKASAYEIPGVSQAVATAKREEGLPSARAQRDQYDKSSGRLVLNAQRLQTALGLSARVCLALMKRAYGDKKIRLKAPSTRLLNEIDWDGMDLREDEIEVRAYIVSAIPNSPSGRAETINEWVQAGVVNPRRAVRMFASPDIDRWEDQESAAEDLALKLIDSALWEGKPMDPESVMGPDGLGLVIDLGGKELMKALCMEEPPPDAHMELLRRLIERAKLLMAPPPGAAPAAQPMPAKPAADVPTDALAALAGAPGAETPMPGAEAGLQ